jgi:glycosyltransferase involved in cell wall biosynthesis
MTGNISGSDLRVTVAVCTHRRYELLARCIDSLYRLTDATPFKVLVVDNSLQADKSSRAREKYTSRHDNLEYIIADRSGISHARNITIELCDTPYIAYVDDDARVEAGWLDALMRVFMDHGREVGVVGGKVIPDWEIDKPEWLDDLLLFPYQLDLGEDVCPVGEDQWLMGVNCAYDVELLRAMGGFNENLGRNGGLLLCHEELDANSRVRELGRSVFYTGRARVRHVVQRERISQEWICRNAFWEGVSECVFEAGLDARSFSGAQVETLTKRCAKLLAGQRERTSTVRLIEDRHFFAREGRRAYGSLELQSPGKRIADVYIVTPTFNSAAYLDGCISSVLSQQGEFHLHYHIQDGGSSDRTMAKVRKWQADVASGAASYGALSCTFTCASNPDNGMYDAILKGFDAFDMEDDGVMAWINSDDALMPDAVAKAVGALSLTGVDWVCGQQNIRNEQGEYVWDSALSFPTALVRAGACDGRNWAHVQQEGSFWNRRLWEKAGGLDLSFRYAGDWDLWRRFARYANLVQLPCALGVFTVRGGQVSTAHLDEYEAEKEGCLPQVERTRRYVELTAEPEYLYTHKAVENIGSWKLVVAPIEPVEIPGPAKGGSAGKEDGRAPRGGFSLWDLFVDAPILHQLYLRSPRPVQRLLTTVKYRFLAPVRSFRNQLPVYVALSRSGLFFPEYYLQHNPEVRRSGMSPLWHYILHGSEEGRMPNPLFDDRWYRLRSPDVVMAGVNPLYHFYRHGWREGRDPCPEFNVLRYLNRNPDVRERGCCPLTHYLVHGIAEGRSIE